METCQNAGMCKTRVRVLFLLVKVLLSFYLSCDGRCGVLLSLAVAVPYRTEFRRVIHSAPATTVSAVSTSAMTGHDRPKLEFRFPVPL